MAIECSDLRQFLRLVQSPAIYRVSASNNEIAFAYPEDDPMQYEFSVKLKPGEYGLLITILYAIGFEHKPLYKGFPDVENMLNWERPGVHPTEVL